MRRLIVWITLGIIAASGLSGCYTTGKVAGEAAEEIEEGADTFEEGYEEGKTPE